MVLAGLFVLQMEFIVDHIVEHHAQSPHVEERSDTGVLARDVLGSVHVGQPSHGVKETNILGDEPWEITDAGLTNISRHVPCVGGKKYMAIVLTCTLSNTS